MLHLHVTKDRKLINKADGKEVNPKDYGVEINGDTVRCGGSVTMGGGTVSNGKLMISSEPFGGGGSGNFVQNIVNSVVNMGKIFANNANHDQGDGDDDVQIVPKPATNAGDCLHLVESVIEHMRNTVVAAHAKQILSVCTPSQICTIVNSCLEPHQGPLIQLLLARYPKSFASSTWQSGHWTRLVKNCLEPHRMAVLMTIMEHVPTAALNTGHVVLALAPHRAACATAFANFAVRRAKLGPDKKSASSDTSTAASTTTASTATAASSPASAPPMDPVDDLKEAIRRSLADHKNQVGCQVSLVDKPPAPSASSLANLKVLNPSQIKDSPATDDNACTVCSENKRIVVNTGCGHASICLACVPKFKPGAKCPLCTKLVVDWLVVSS